MNRPIKSLGICSAVFCTLVATVGIRYAAAADANFGGKTVTVTIGFSAGGGVDLYGRTLGRHLVHHLPGNPALVVLNQPGAGGVVALNEWSKRAEPNGLNVTIGAQSQTDPDALSRTHAKFSPTSFNMVGGLAAYSQGLFINKNAVDRLYDKSDKPVVMGMVGSTLRGGTYQVLWGAAFLGWNVKWVRGYPSTSEVRQALERGEIEMATFGASKDFEYLLKTGRFTIISQTGYVQAGQRVKRPLLGNAPILSDLVRGKIHEPMARKAFEYWENVSQIGMWLALPPRTPDSIVGIYVKAFDATVSDPKFQDEYGRIDPDSIVAHKPELEKLINTLAQVSPETLQYLEAELKQQGFGSGK
jgi:tripartite-type tricarboxylate transporter receptor subunit TctC